MGTSGQRQEAEIAVLRGVIRCRHIVKTKPEFPLRLRSLLETGGIEINPALSQDGDYSDRPSAVIPDI